MSAFERIHTKVVVLNIISLGKIMHLSLSALLGCVCGVFIRGSLSGFGVRSLGFESVQCAEARALAHVRSW